MRFFIFFLLLLLGVVGYLAFLNQGVVTVYLPTELVFDVPIVAFFLLSMAFGGLIVILGVGVKETKNLFLNWRDARQQKKEEKIQDLYTQAVNAFFAKRYQDATTLFEKILGINPGHVNALLRLGTIFRGEKNYTEAIRLHRKAKVLEENNKEVLLALGWDYEQAQRYDEAVLALRDVLALDRSNLTALFRLRDLLNHLERWEEAHDLQEEILKSPIGESDKKRELSLFLGIKYELGCLLSQRGEGDKARNFFKEANKLDPSFLPPYLGLAELLINEEKFQNAADLLRKAYEITKNIILLHHLEKLFLDLNSPEKIIRTYQDILQQNPDDKVLRFYMGKLYYRLEMVDDAYDTLAELESTDERFPDLHKILGNLYMRRGQLDCAVEEFRKALNLRKMVLIPYYCPQCDFHTTEWSGRCKRCGRWDTYTAIPILNQPKKQLTKGETLRLSRVSVN